MKRILLSMLGIVFALNAWAETLQLDSCQSMARQNYPLIQQYNLLEKSKDFNIKNANKAYLPKINFTLIGGYVMSEIIPENEVRLIGVAQLNQVLWDGGATSAQKDIIEAQNDASKAQVDVNIYELKSRVNQLFFGILLLNEQLKQIDVQTNQLNLNKDKVRQLSDNGLAYRTDEQEISVELLKLEQQKIELENTKLGYTQMLSLLIGEKLDSSIELEIPEMTNTSLDINRPELAMYESQRSLIKAQSKMNNVSLMPKFGIMGMGLFLTPGFNLGQKEMKNLAVVGLSASWDISGLYKYRTNKRLTDVNLQLIDTQEATFMHNLSQQSTKTSAEINKQKAILQRDAEIVQLQKEIREGYELQYGNGACTMQELLNATENESKAQNQKSMHEVQLLLSTYELITINNYQK